MPNTPLQMSVDVGGAAYYLQGLLVKIAGGSTVGTVPEAQKNDKFLSFEPIPQAGAEMVCAGKYPDTWSAAAKMQAAAVGKCMLSNLSGDCDKFQKCI